MDITQKGTPVPTDFGVLHVGDIVRAKLYERTSTGGTKFTTYEGVLVYHIPDARFLIESDTDLSYNLDMAEPPVIVKKWNE